jgi:hypothetical protein
MALTYEQSSALMKDQIFVGRIKVACIKYADYIYGEASNTPAHSSRVRWMQYCNSNPETTAIGLAPIVVMDPAVISDGAAVSDVALQSATETAINKTL